MLRRKIYDRLTEWKNREHKPLVIYGQRQVGKTFIIREFAKNEYGNLVAIDFVKNPGAKGFFESDLSVDSILSRIAVEYPGTEIEPGRTLILLDEIQECPRAYTSLKYFKEDGRYDVIATGSMMGVKMPNIKESADTLDVMVPLGYEECVRMYGLDFEEFLWAKGIGEDITRMLRDCMRRREPIDDFILGKIDSYFREFMIVGGMPEAVSEFVRTGKFTGVRSILGDLDSGCVKDINRYNSGEDIVKTTECYESIPDQLSESNKKFMYSRIRGERSRKAADAYQENLLWIKAAGYGNFCYAAKDLSLPLKSNRKSFKVYQSDTGMLVNRYGENCIKAVYTSRYDYNLGAIAENAVAEGLMKSGYVPRYHSVQKGDKRMELDFVVENGDGICVIEVKSGKDRSAPSISKADRHYKVAHRMFFEESNIYTDDDGFEHFPLFTASFFRELEPEWNGPEL